MEQEQDVFMKEFKRFRQLDIQSDEFKNSVLSSHEPNLSYFRKQNINLNLNEKQKKFFDLYGLKDLSEWKCYELIDIPGLFVIPNPFKNGHQRYFIKRSLADYHNMPNKTNLDAHIKRENNLWHEAINNNNKNEFNKLRWATIGYHYDWTKKVYNLEDFNEIPIDIKNICEIITKSIGFENFEAQAGIINYYHLNSTLSAHQDVAEYNMKAPLISVSFGSSAVFLIGGNSRMIKPKAIHVTSGDFVIMSSTSRLAFHAVPKIFKNTNLNCIFNYENIDEKFRNSIYHVDDNEWKNYFEYIHINRINLNIRQVFD